MRQLESLQAWQAGRLVAKGCYLMTMQKSFGGHFVLSDQIRRAAISIPANIAEGYALGTQPQLVRGVRIALGSAAELRTHLLLVGDIDLAPVDVIVANITAVDRCIGLIVGLLKRHGARPPA